MQTDTAEQFASNRLPSTPMKIHSAAAEMLHASRRTPRF